jgi:hypothetical protein
VRSSRDTRAPGGFLTYEMQTIRHPAPGFGRMYAPGLSAFEFRDTRMPLHGIVNVA